MKYQMKYYMKYQKEVKHSSKADVELIGSAGRILDSVDGIDVILISMKYWRIMRPLYTESKFKTTRRKIRKPTTS